MKTPEDSSQENVVKFPSRYVEMSPDRVRLIKIWLCGGTDECVADGRMEKNILPIELSPHARAEYELLKAEGFDPHILEVGSVVADMIIDRHNGAPLMETL